MGLKGMTINIPSIVIEKVDSRIVSFLNLGFDFKQFGYFF